MQNYCPLGVLVFPTDRSDLILGNPSLLHYGSFNESNSSADKKLHYPENKSRKPGNPSNPVHAKPSFHHHSFNTNATEKFNQSVKLSQQCSKFHRTSDSGKEELNVMSNQQNSLILQIGNEGKKWSENEMKNVDGEADRQKLSNFSSEEIKFSKFPKINNTSTSYSSTNNSKLLSPNVMMQRKQEINEAIAQPPPPPLADEEQYKMKEILDDLDNALDCDEHEHTSVNQIQQNSQKNALISGDRWVDDSKYSSTYEYGSAYKSQDCKREYEIKSNKIKTTVMISDHLNDQLIQELKQLPQGIMSLKDYKLKQKNSRIEREKSLENEIEEMRKACTLEKYMSQVPEFISGTRKPLPSWKRSMLAQKIANEDMRRQEENLREKFHEWKSQRYPIRHKSKS